MSAVRVQFHFGDTSERWNTDVRSVFIQEFFFPVFDRLSLPLSPSFTASVALEKVKLAEM